MWDRKTREPQQPSNPATQQPSNPATQQPSNPATQQPSNPTARPRNRATALRQQLLQLPKQHIRLVRFLQVADVFSDDVIFQEGLVAVAGGEEDGEVRPARGDLVVQGESVYVGEAEVEDHGVGHSRGNPG